MITIDLDSNFWDVNSNFKYLEPFKSFHREDKTSKKKRSSSIMWIASSFLHPDSIYINIDKNERYESIVEGFMDSTKFLEDNYNDILLWTSKLEELIFNNPAKKALREWEMKMLERAAFIRDTTYSTDYYEVDERGHEKKIAGTHKMLDDMMKVTKSLYDDYFRIKSELEKSSEDITIGNKKKSFLEQERE